jgi:hypothetical protein
VRRNLGDLAKAVAEGRVVLTFVAGAIGIDPHVVLDQSCGDGQRGDAELVVEWRAMIAALRGRYR